MKIKNIAFSGFAAAILAGVSATDASAAINLVTQEYVTTEMNKKQNTLTEANAGEGIKIENGVISAEVDLTNTIGSLTDAEGNAITVEQALAGKQDALTTEQTTALDTIAGNENLETVLGSGVSSDTVQQVADNATAIDSLETTVAAKANAEDVTNSLLLKEDVANKLTSLTEDEYQAMDATTKANKYTSVAAVETITTKMVESVNETAADVTELTTKVNTNTADISTLKGLVGETSVESQIADATANVVTTDNMAEKLDGYATDTELATKADASTVETLSSKVTAAEGEIDTLQADVKGLQDAGYLTKDVADGYYDKLGAAADVQTAVNDAKYVSGASIANTKGGFLVLSDGNGNVTLSEQIVIVGPGGTTDMLTGETVSQ